MSNNNNEVVLTGLVTEFGFSHKVVNNTISMYKGKMQIARLSGILDTVPFYTLRSDIEVGKCYTIVGNIQTHNLRGKQGNSHKVMYVKPRIMWERLEDVDHLNSVELCGYLVSKSQSRFTPFGRRIADFVIALNGAFGKSSYPNLIAWGATARMLDTCHIGDKLHVIGRFQSREYEKDGITHTVYEISCSEVEQVNDSLCD